MLSALATRLIQLAAAVGSIFALLLMLVPEGHDWSAWQLVFLLASIALPIWLAASEIRMYFQSKPRIFENEAEIRNYLHEWIGTNRRAAIFTHDHSWVKDEDMKSMLRDKARNNELQMFMPKSTDFSRELEECGAITVYYGDENVLKTRFTIVNVGSTDAKVAIGHEANGAIGSMSIAQASTRLSSWPTTSGRASFG